MSDETFGLLLVVVVLLCLLLCQNQRGRYVGGVWKKSPPEKPRPPRPPQAQGLKGEQDGNSR